MQALILPIARLIPARAGKTWRPEACRTRTSAHPRAGGENTERTKTMSRYFGSSPRGRGKQGELSSDIPYSGLIPARAGKTSTSAKRKRVSSAHPRAGGENYGLASILEENRGSSPRGRGKHTLSHGLPRIPRLIPARAGKTGQHDPA